MANELEDNIRKLRESLTVTSAQVLRHEDAIKDHDEWLRSHELAMTRHDREMAEMRESHAKAGARHDKEMAELRAEGKALDKRIGDLVSGIGEFMRKKQ
jgi:predicted  nucleic acid-binding Zn-ribbon protein